jgi:hypothetical protein
MSKKSIKAEIKSFVEANQTHKFWFEAFKSDNYMDSNNVIAEVKGSSGASGIVDNVAKMLAAKDAKVKAEEVFIVAYCFDRVDAVNTDGKKSKKKDNKPVDTKLFNCASILDPDPSEKNAKEKAEAAVAAEAPADAQA